MKLDALFPPCQAQSCPQQWRHKHPLAHQLDLIRDDSKYLCMLGGYGSAKTLAACILCVLLMLTYPGNQGIVVRRTYPKLHDSTLKIFMETVDRAEIEGVKYRENRDGYSHKIVFPNDSEVVFRPSKDLGRFLGPQYGFFFIDEAKEEPEKVFTDLQGRLRLPHVAAQGGLKGILLSNPPHDRHWIAKWFGKNPGVTWHEVEVEPGQRIRTAYRLMRSSTRENPHVPPEYLADLLRRPASEVAAIVEGLYSFTPEGPPVYPQYRAGLHLSSPETQAHAPIIRSWDFGHRHPAVTWSQTWRCRENTLHWMVLAEYDSQHIETEDFAKEVIDATERLWPGLPPTMILDCGDRAGAQVSEKGPGPIIRLTGPPFNLDIRYVYREILPGVEAIRTFLRQDCPCGDPHFMVHRRAQNVSDALSGGYHLPEDGQGKPTESPVKDGFYDDFMDSLRYAYENFVRYEIDSPGWIEGEAARAADTPDHVGMGWMDPEPTEAQIAADILRLTQGRPGVYA